jgi:hypothetical protein
LWLGFRLLGAFADDFHEMGFDVFDGHLLHEGLDVDLLGLEEIEDVGEAVECAELKRALAG